MRSMFSTGQRAVSPNSSPTKLGFWRVGRKISLAILIVFLLATALVSSIVTSKFSDAMRTEFSETRLKLSSVLGSYAGQFMEQGDVAGLKDAMSRILESGDNGFVAYAVLSESNKVIARAGEKSALKSMLAAFNDPSLENKINERGHLVTVTHIIGPDGKRIGSFCSVWTTDDLAAASNAITSSLLVSIVLISLAVMVLMGLLIRQLVGASIAQIAHAMAALAAGKLDGESKPNNRRDEIGSLSKALAVFHEQALENDRLQREKNSMADSFDADIGQLVKQLQQQTHVLANSASAMVQATENSKAATEKVDRTADQTSSDLNSIASGVAQLTKSTDHIANQLTHAVSASDQAQQCGRTTSEAMRGLDDQVAGIADIVALITSIAEQTNLLALNATIEAARAGEAGKGFAVVAQEVKTLATQTAEATTQISEQMAAIQDIATKAGHEVATIEKALQETGDVCTAIADAAGQQRQAGQSINTDLDQVVRATSEVLAEVKSIHANLIDTDNAAKTIDQTTDDLAHETQSLESGVTRFLQRVRKSA